MALVMGWLARSRKRGTSGVPSRELRYPRSMVIVGGVTSLMFFAFATLAYFTSKNPVEIWVYAIFIGFGMLGTYILADALRAHYRVDDQGIDYRTLLSGSGRMSWADIRRVSYSPSAKWLRLEKHTGETVRLSVMLIGLPEFARLCLTRTPVGVIEPEADAILKDMSIGQLPSIWG